MRNTRIVRALAEYRRRRLRRQIMARADEQFTRVLLYPWWQPDGTPRNRGARRPARGYDRM